MAGFDLGALLQDPGFTTGLGMLGSNQNPGQAFQGAAMTAQQLQGLQVQNQMKQLALQQALARQNFNPSQFLLNQQQANASPQAAGPATQAALAQQQGPQAGAQIAGNTQTPYEPPQGSIGNVDIQGMMNAGLKAGMSPEEVQQMAGVIDPMTAIKMKLMGQPALVVPPAGQLVSPGMSQIAQLNGQAPGAGSGVLATNNNAPPDSPMGIIDSLTKALNTYAPNGPSPDPAKYAAVQSMMANKTGSFEQGNPEDIAKMVDAVGTYQVAPPSGQAMRSPISQKIMAGVAAKYPQFDAKNYEMAQNGLNAFATGPQGDTVRKMNVSVNHMDALLPLVDALKNGNAVMINQAAQKYAEQTGQTAPTNFKAAAQVVTDEVTSALQAGGGTLSDREKKELSEASSPQQLKGIIQQYQNLLGGQLQGLSKQYEASTLGRKDFADRFLTGRTKQVLGTGAGAGPAQKPPQIAPADALAELKRRGLVK